MEPYIGSQHILFMAGQASTEQAFFTLTALADVPRHGYGIVGEVADLPDGRVH